VDISTREKILLRAAKMYPPIITNGLPPNDGGFEVLTDIVGRRPTRKGGARIEREDCGGIVLIHAYGIGGRGYETSWGIAGEVLKFVNDSEGKQ
jgi:D-amino-acid oxidase